MVTVITLVVIVGVAVVTRTIAAITKRRREGVLPPLGDADAFEGNLLVPPAGGRERQSGRHTSHGQGGHGHFGGHSGHSGGHSGHDGGLGGHGGGFAGGGHH